MSTRAIRGATCLTADDSALMTDAVVELLTEIMSRNSITKDDIISVLFTATPDLKCTFPASAARKLDFGDVPLICAQELDIDGALSHVVRVMVHVDTELSKSEIKHIYLRGAEVLRQDIAQ
jgi:chorismate mutase